MIECNYCPVGSSTGSRYEDYDASGTYVITYTATGSGAFNSLYFYWSGGRYSSHDGFEARTGGLEYWPSTFFGYHRRFTKLFACIHLPIPCPIRLGLGVIPD
ncbi:MAG: hypothetical protein H7A24_09840 [Leptospiraceae bacterium]|nr:hypothetical protein [Leptospiraceae bacterium]